MLQKSKSFFLSFILFMLLQLQGYTQNEISSPYSGYGVGLLTNSTPNHLVAMGGTAYAMQNPHYINFRNPASYFAFDSLSFIADASFSIMSGKLRTNLETQKGSFARPNYIAIGLPITKIWRTSVGILPFSDKGYTIVDKKNDPNFGNIVYKYAGEGGLMQLYWGNALRICKGLTIGLNASYIFGTLADTRYVEFSGSNFYNTRISQFFYVDGIYLTLGLQYFTNIKTHHRLGFGAVYENSAYIWTKENLLISYYEKEYSSASEHDTVLNVIGQKGRLQIPQSIGGGVSYSYKNKLLIGADVTWQNWKKYKLMGETDSLKNALISSVGFQYIPDPTSNKFFKNIALRAGFRYSTGYIQIRNTPITEWVVSFGLGIPLKTFNSRSSINIMFEYGRMGTLKNNLIQQDNFKFSLSFILQEKWYQRTKLE
ncbi:MAG: hypothetical protein RR356_04040 [Bacteroidales bacterium]